MDVAQLLEHIKHQPDQVEFDQVIEVIDQYYRYTPTAFYNGIGDDRQFNAPGTNLGSSKIFAFAQLHQLDTEQTLACFGKYYREDVLQHPQGNDHTNIRRFMRYGWPGIKFEDFPLTPID